MLVEVFSLATCTVQCLHIYEQYSFRVDVKGPRVQSLTSLHVVPQNSGFNYYKAWIGFESTLCNNIRYEYEIDLFQ